MEIKIIIEDWEYKMLEAFIDTPEKHINNNLKIEIQKYKDICLDKFIQYCRENNLPIFYKNDEDLINKLYDLGLIKNLHDLNSEFLKNN
jgi:hypothetical protein